MIALRDGLPLMVAASGVAVSFRRRWLQAALARAATRAGYQNWSPARDLALSVSHYLERRYEYNVIPVAKLENLVRKALLDLGFEDVARSFGSKRTRADLQQLTLSL